MGIENTLPRDELNRLVVRIRVKDKAMGSGIILLPKAVEGMQYAYVLTALHCLQRTNLVGKQVMHKRKDIYIEYKKDDRDRKFLPPINPIKIHWRHDDKSYDFALLLVNVSELRKIIGDIPTVDIGSPILENSSYHFCGFSMGLALKRRRLLEAKYSANNSMKEQFTIKVKKRYASPDSSDPSGIVRGFSGSGLFCRSKVGGIQQFLLVGIIIKLDPDDYRHFIVQGIQFLPDFLIKIKLPSVSKSITSKFLYTVEECIEAKRSEAHKNKLLGKHFSQCMKQQTTFEDCLECYKYFKREYTQQCTQFRWEGKKKPKVALGPRSVIRTLIIKAKEISNSAEVLFGTYAVKEIFQEPHLVHVLANGLQSREFYDRRVRKNLHYLSARPHSNAKASMILAMIRLGDFEMATKFADEIPLQHADHDRLQTEILIAKHDYSAAMKRNKQLMELIGLPSRVQDWISFDLSPNGLKACLQWLRIIDKGHISEFYLPAKETCKTLIQGLSKQRKWHTVLNGENLEELKICYLRFSLELSEGDGTEILQKDVLKALQSGKKNLQTLMQRLSEAKRDLLIAYIQNNHSKG